MPWPLPGPAAVVAAAAGPAVARAVVAEGTGMVGLAGGSEGASGRGTWARGTGTIEATVKFYTSKIITNL